MTLALTACGKTSDDSTSEQTKPLEPTDLTGTWASEDNNGSWMEATIQSGTISINWVYDNGDTKSIYWIGTYTAPEEYVKEYSWTSKRDKENTDTALLASTNESKDFTYSNGKISYEVSMLGTTTQMELTKESNEVNLESEQTQAETIEEKLYTNGEPWIVENLFSVTFTAASQTDERNEYADQNPAQVIILNYDYENIGLDEDLYISHFKVMDANGEMANSYPSSNTTYPQPTPKGGKCIGAQETYGLNNISEKITVIVEVFDDDFNKYEAKFELTIQ